MASSRNRHCANYIGTPPDMTRHRQHRVSCLAGGVNWALVVISPPPLAPRGKTRVSRLVAYLVGHWHCPHSMLNRVYVTVRCPSVRPSVCLSACPVAATKEQRRQSPSKALISKCGQYGVYSQGTRLTKYLFSSSVDLVSESAASNFLHTRGLRINASGKLKSSLLRPQSSHNIL